jgi:hypothetical protein
LASSNEAHIEWEGGEEQAVNHLITSFQDYCQISVDKKGRRATACICGTTDEDRDTSDNTAHFFAENATQNPDFGIEIDTSFGIDCRYNSIDDEVTISSDSPLQEECRNLLFMDPFTPSVSVHDVDDKSIHSARHHRKKKFTLIQMDLLSPSDKSVSVICLSSSDEEGQNEREVLIDLCSNSTNSTI